jgi:rsbT antagonist protein RsbS
MGDPVVTIQVDMHDRLATALQDDLANRISVTRARGVSSISRSWTWWTPSSPGCSATSRRWRVLDAEMVLVGMQPSVAITLVEMGSP